MHRHFKRIMTLVLAVVTAISVAIPALAASTIESSKSTSVTVKMGERNTILKDQNGKAIGGSYWEYTSNKDSVKGPAYCINHGLKAVPSNVSLPIQGQYAANPKTLGAFANGYPQVPLAAFVSENSLTGLTEDEYEYATQIAIWAALGQLGVEGTQFTSGKEQIKNPSASGDAQQIRTFKALQVILGKASTWTQNQWRGMYMRYRENVAGGALDLFHAQGLAGLADEGGQVQLETIDGIDYYTIVYYVSSATPTKPNGNFIDVVPDGPAGTILVDADTNEVLATKQTASGTTAYRVPTTGPVKTDLNANGVEYVGKYKLAIPADNAAASGTVNMYSEADITQYELFIAYNENKAQQSYIIADPSVGKVSSAGSFKWTSEETEEGALQVTKTDGQGWPLSGATFELRNAGGYAESQTTSEDGTVLWENLEPGNYTLIETVPPAGYAPREPMQLAVGASITTYATIRNDNAPKLFIKKVDKQNNRVLEGAVFELTQIDGSFKTTGTTQFDGIIELGTDQLPFGSYEVRELSAPEGYLKDTAVQTVHWDGSMDVLLTFFNIRVPGITLYKTSESGEPLSDAVFNVYKDGQVIRSITTDYNGAAQFFVTESGEGYYEFEEISAPSGYVLDSTKQGIHFDPYNPATQADPVVIVVNKAKAHLQIVKIDANTSVGVGGCTFEVYRDTALIGSYITDSSGEIMISVDPGVYLVKEVGVPEGYVLNPMPQEIEILAGDGMKTLVFLNDPKPGLYILKVDELTGDFLANAEFSVERNGGQIVYQGLTDNTGIIYLENLEPGWYTVRELAAPHGYLIRDEHKDVLLEPGKVVQVKFDNRPRPKLEILKVDTVTRQPLAGAKFRVTKTEDKTVSEYITGANGRILIENLDEAIYTVEEITAPDGYILDPQHKEIALEWGKTKTLVYEDMRKPTLIITKTNALTFEPIPDTTYRVEHERSTGAVALIGTYRTDENGQIILRNADVGWYVITETLPAPGFTPSANPTVRRYLTPGENSYTVFGSMGGIGGDVSGNNIRVTSGSDYIVGYEIVNYPLNSIVIRKANAVTGELLAGAVFELRQVNEELSGSSGTLIGRYTTDASGTIVITGLVPGGFIVEEVQAPANYMLTENSMQQVWLKPDGTSIVETTFGNYPYGGILITKVDAVTNKPLPNATFHVTDSKGAVVGNTNGVYVTNASGEILIPNVKPGAYVVTETAAPDGYTIDTTPQTIDVGTDGKVYKVSFKNQPVGSLTILKFDTATREPLAGAEFRVTDSTGAVVGTGNGKYTTDATGQINISNLPKGSYIVQETKAPDGYILENQSQTIAVDYGKTYSLEFFNKKMSGLQIIKIDSVTKQPLKGAEFAVYKQSGEIVDRYVTDADGVIIIDTLTPGWYKVVETKTLPGYVLDETPKDVEITANQFVKVVFENAPLSGLIIRKVDAGTREPLEGAEFTVKKADGLLIGVYRSGTDGIASVGTLEPGWYQVTETKAPEGYTLGDNVQTVQITNSKTVTIEFQNRPYGSLVIKKIDEITGAPLSGANFEVQKQGGGFVGEYTTGVDGTVNILSLAPGWYVISETKAPTGYTLDSTAKTVEVKSGVPCVATFSNKPLSGIQIIKLDTQTKAPLTGATFLVERVNGERIGSYKTDSAGKIIVPDLAEGTYIISETAAPDGYILDEAPKTVIVKSGKITTVEFFNKALSGLKIIKLNSATRQPIAGVEFAITKMSGEKVTTEFNGTTFKTDSTGQIYIPGLADGYYTVTETRSADGYILDGEPKTVSIQSGKPTVLEVLNTPMSGLLIVKTDAATGKPLAGVVFDVKRADGQFVAGLILDGNQPNTEANSPNKTTSPNGDITGSYTTDANGRILINGLPVGEYHVVERKALDGYELDTAVHAATVTPGKLTTLQITNKQMAGLRLLKIDSITKKPIFGVEFMVFDANNKVVGTYITDNNGLIDFSGILTQGRYTIRETRAAAGYYLDDMPRTVEFVSGKVTEVRWENTPQLGQIQITKKSGDSNEVNGLPAGTPLAGAVFEVYDYKTGNVLDRFTSGTDGRAVSKPLPLGRYTVKEVQAPQYYRVSTQTLDIEIEFATQIIKQEFLNYSANTGVYIKKTGNVEAMPGDTIAYTIKAVQNTSTVPLTDFYWRDILPTDAVRLTKLVTGTYNQSLKYKIIATTNKGDTRVIADNLSTTKNNVIDCSNASLGLRSDEFITSVTYVFGNVKAGFSQVEQPQIFVKVLSTLKNGYQFSNKADVGGKYGSEWIVSNSTWLTKIFSNAKLPRTGY